MCGLSRRKPAGAEEAGDSSGTVGTEGATVPALVSRLSHDEPLDTRSRGRLIASLAAGLATSAKRAGSAAVNSGRWLGDVVLEVAPQLPIRDLGALRDQHDGLDGDALAEALVTAAARATAAVGAAGGAVAAVEFAAPPALTAPVLVAAETLAVVAIEVKLLAELHEVFRRRPPGGQAQRAAGYVTAWVSQRGIDPRQHAGLGGALSGAVQRQLRQRLVRRAGRNVTTYLPYLVGAVAGGELNRRETRRFGEAMLRELRS